jgi:hypothetical protein
LPTDAENESFVGHPSAHLDGSGHYTWTPNSENEADPGVGVIHYGTANGAELPAAGRRYVKGGEASFQGTTGFYWSSTLNANTCYLLYFPGKSLQPSAGTTYGEGYSIRCVPQ